jgi:hypothetical protein
MGADLTYLTSVDAILGQNHGGGLPIGVQWVCCGDRLGKVADVGSDGECSCEDIRGDDVVRMTMPSFLPYLYRLITLLYFSHIDYAE